MIKYASVSVDDSFRGDERDRDRERVGCVRSITKRVIIRELKKMLEVMFT